MWLYAELLGNNLALKFVGWSVIPMLLILFSAGFAHIVSPQVICNKKSKSLGLKINKTH